MIRNRLGITSLVIIILVCGCIDITENEKTNLLINSGFEEVLNGQPICWEPNTMDEHNWSFSLDNMVKHSGNTSASIEGKGNWAYWMQSFEKDKIPLGKEVTVSGYIKTENIDQRAEIEIYYIANDNYTRAETAPITGTKDWTFVTASCYIPEDTVRMDICLMIWGPGKVWFDDVQLLASKEVVQEPQTPMEKKEWTLMFYDDADFAQGFNPRRWFEEEAYSGENLNVVMLEDTYGGPAGTRYVHSNGTSVKVKDNGEVNMASSETLQDFISFCKKWYPANRYMLLLYDHGSAWRGACVDETTNPDGSDWLTPTEMERALAETGSVDIIGFSAPCLMGAIEPAYELRDCVDVYIGSEETSGYGYWGNIMGPLCELLNKETEISNIELGNEIIELMRENCASLPDYKESITMSAIRCDRIEALVEAIDLFAKDLSVELSTSWEQIASALMATQSFSGETIDIYDFADKCSSISPKINRSCQNVKQKLTDVVINECHGKDHPRAYGLTVYFPQFEQVDPEYARCGLDFTQVTHWDELLSAFSNELMERVAPVGEDQLLLNGGFELVLNSQPICWEPNTMDEHNWSFSPDNMVKHSGNTSVSIKGKGNWAQWMQSFEKDKIPIGKEVTVSGYIKTENVDQRAEIVIYYIANGNYTSVETAPITDTKDWTFVTVSCYIPEDTVRMGIRLMIWGSGKVWFDDVQLLVGRGTMEVAKIDTHQRGEHPVVTHEEVGLSVLEKNGVKVFYTSTSNKQKALATHCLDIIEQEYQIAANIFGLPQKELNPCSLVFCDSDSDPYVVKCNWFSYVDGVQCWPIIGESSLPLEEPINGYLLYHMLPHEIADTTLRVRGVDFVSGAWLIEGVGEYVGLQCAKELGGLDNTFWLDQVKDNMADLSKQEERIVDLSNRSNFAGFGAPGSADEAIFYVGSLVAVQELVDRYGEIIVSEIVAENCKTTDEICEMIKKSTGDDFRGELVLSVKEIKERYVSLLDPLL